MVACLVSLAVGQYVGWPAVWVGCRSGWVVSWTLQQTRQLSRTCIAAQRGMAVADPSPPLVNRTARAAAYCRVLLCTAYRDSKVYVKNSGLYFVNKTEKAAARVSMHRSRWTRPRPAACDLCWVPGRLPLRCSLLMPQTQPLFPGIGPRPLPPPQSQTPTHLSRLSRHRSHPQPPAPSALSCPCPCP